MIRWLILVLLAFVPAFAWPAENPADQTETMTLEQAVALSLENNRTSRMLNWRSQSRKIVWP